MKPKIAGQRVWRSAVCLAGVVAISSTLGCYQRTIAARGIGASSYEISEPYQESGQLDEWIFGPTPGSRKITPMTRNNTRLDR
ncbi:MAG: hypothetical protein AB7G11_14600 [Phycisphaerales bacterium]